MNSIADVLDPKVSQKAFKEFVDPLVELLNNYEDRIKALEDKVQKLEERK